MAAPGLRLQDGRSMPQLGLGVWRTPPAATAEVVSAAIGAGYRLIDTAPVYGNEAGVGEGIRRSGLPREDLFVVTKVWNSDQGYDRTKRALDASLARLDLDYLDAYLIHWPAPRLNRAVDTWRALIDLRAAGRVRSIGVSNFMIPHLQDIIDATGVAPAINQVELHPQFQQADLRAFHAAHGVATQCWAPLGKGRFSGDPVLTALGAKHGKSAVQIVLRWHVQIGACPIPKTVREERMAENLDVFDFALDDEDMTILASLDRADGRMGSHPTDVD